MSLAPQFADRATEFVAELESVRVELDRVARIIINERTGTVVLGNDVHIRPVAIMHGNLTVEIQLISSPSHPGRSHPLPDNSYPKRASAPETKGPGTCF